MFLIRGEILLYKHRHNHDHPRDQIRRTDSRYQVRGHLGGLWLAWGYVAKKPLFMCMLHGRVIWDYVNFPPPNRQNALLFAWLISRVILLKLEAPCFELLSETCTVVLHATLAAISSACRESIRPRLPPSPYCTAV